MGMTLLTIIPRVPLAKLLLPVSVNRWSAGAKDLAPNRETYFLTRRNCNDFIELEVKTIVQTLWTLHSS